MTDEHFRLHLTDGNVVCSLFSFCVARAIVNEILYEKSCHTTLFLAPLELVFRCPSALLFRDILLRKFILLAMRQLIYK